MSNIKYNTQQFATDTEALEHVSDNDITEYKLKLTGYSYVLWWRK